MQNTFKTTPEVPSFSGLINQSEIRSMSLKDLYFYTPNPADNLLGNEFLCRKGILIIAGPSHVGKSSMSIQQDVLWSLGRSAFGIEPARPLNMLTFQAENDESDMHRATRGIISSLGLSAAEIDKVGERTKYITLRSSSGVGFLEELERILSTLDGWPDIIRLEPLMAFIGDDPTNTKAVQGFMRGGLSKLLEKFNLAAICTHHTTKTQYMDTGKLNPYDFQYCMAGAADLTNLARAVIAIVPGKDGRTFSFIAAKGKAKIGWLQPARLFAHASGTVFWEDAVAPAAPPRTSPTRTATPEKLLSLFGENVELRKDELLARCPAADIGQNVARDLIAQLTSAKESRLQQFEKPRAGARPEVWLRLVVKTSPDEMPPPKPCSLDDDIP